MVWITAGAGRTPSAGTRLAGRRKLIATVRRRPANRLINKDVKMTATQRCCAGICPYRLWLLLAAGLICLSGTGCIGLTAQLMYWVKGGPKVDAEFDGLKGKRVAVVCVDASSGFSPHSVGSLLERAVAMNLREKVDKIDLVPPDAVADWIDTNDWDQADYREIGKGVKADLVLAIDLTNVTLHEGLTLYKGRADVAVSVYDMTQEGKRVFHRELPEFAYPQNGARHSTELSESRFRQLFIAMLAQQISRYFHAYQFEDDFARDAMGLAL
jgi:hypothetical protein